MDLLSCECSTNRKYKMTVTSSTIPIIHNPFFVRTLHITSHHQSHSPKTITHIKHPLVATNHNPAPCNFAEETSPLNTRCGEPHLPTPSPFYIYRQLTSQAPVSRVTIYPAEWRAGPMASRASRASCRCKVAMHVRAYYGVGDGAWDLGWWVQRVGWWN